jgi:MFS family permease
MARTHALMTAGDVAMFAALSGSVLFSLSPDAQRPKVLLYLLVSVAPFAVVAPLIGPTIDRLSGGRRFVMQITAVVRAVLYVLMASHVDDLLLYPLVFGAMVMSKTYQVSKSALVPAVVRNEAELVEANSKLSLISGLVGVVIFGPLAGLGKLSAGFALVLGAVILVVGALSARRLPRDAVAVAPAQREEVAELRSAGIVLATGAMALIRASVGFLFFHLFFWLNDDYGLAAFGLAAGASTLGSMLGNVAAPRLRVRLREENLLVGSLGIVAVVGVAAALIGGLPGAVLAAALVSFSASLGRMAFDSIVQRDAPDANQGRAFARFETRFQLAWVLAGLLAVLFTLPGQVGFLVVGLFGVFAGATYLIGARAVSRGRPVPPSLTARARRGLQTTAARRRDRRGNTPAAGSSRPPLPPPARPPRR